MTRFRFREGEAAEMLRVRVRTVGCYPLTGAMESDAADVAAILAELDGSSERSGRLIDRDQPPRWSARSARAISDAERHAKRDARRQPRT